MCTSGLRKGSNLLQRPPGIAVKLSEKLSDGGHRLGVEGGSFLRV